jgi:4-hydroxy-tetrahydrodipicolinate reductase
MGASVCGSVAADQDLALVAAVDPAAAGETVEGIPVAKDLKAFADAGVEVVVDFTVADAARRTVPWLAMHGIHAVVGTTGLTEDDLALFAQEFGKGGPNCVVAPNFSISAVLMMRCAEIAAPFFDTAEIIELHHDGKADAPSGTAIATAERMAAASDQWAPDPTRTEVLPGARGGTGAAGIHVHAVRMRGMVAHQEVILGARGQSLTIRQDSYDRESFMPGVILACKKVGEFDGLTVGLERLLGL